MGMQIKMGLGINLEITGDLNGNGNYLMGVPVAFLPRSDA